MTIHAKNGNLGCISFRFMNFLFSEGGTPPLETPLELKVTYGPGGRT